jgi:hypothetical protein
MPSIDRSGNEDRHDLIAKSDRTTELSSGVCPSVQAYLSLL